MPHTQTSFNYNREKYARSKEEVPFFPLVHAPKYRNGHEHTTVDEMMSDFVRQAGSPSLNGSNTSS